ncbi:hypothetical protein AYJ54_24675 [Bradyrhizobium centrolobii]|uniref:Yop protein translocation protein D periplasmic domain-containing protein n=2 Tax=Bradyrhizobium TaxID=374 RepID=A0A176Z023_9BRAD|nr:MULTISPECIES: hypothetical protein [Bradyrhizobium]OAF03756.1 hypothetical protein AYJ54_24675 [Bradyrhizobium centrolobii]OAF12500.1 hypothetical protein AXW67_20025 [Bradyrhizobium neotropicale]
MDEAPSLHFEVLSGLYCGLSRKAAMGTSLIGSGLDADIVFVEQGLEPHHLRVTLLCNSIEIEVLSTGISIEDKGNIAAGERVVFPLPIVIRAGTMSIRWTVQDSAPAGSIGPSRVSLLTVAIVLLGLLGIGTFSAVFFDNASAGAPSIASSHGVELGPKLTVNRPDDRIIHSAAELLQEEVDRAGLLNIKVNSGLGIVTAEGAVPPALAARWQEVQQWFDHRTHGTLTLVNGVAVKEEKAPSSIAIEAVWRGTPPYLLVGGQKYFVGALLSDGWTLDRIEERRVLLSRNGRLAAISF